MKEKKTCHQSAGVPATIVWAQKKQFHMGGSKNSGTPKSSILIGFSIVNHPFWGTIIVGNTHIRYCNEGQLGCLIVGCPHQPEQLYPRKNQQTNRLPHFDPKRKITEIWGFMEITHISVCKSDCFFHITIIDSKRQFQA